jgi:hypothetical protein
MIRYEKEFVVVREVIAPRDAQQVTPRKQSASASVSFDPSAQAPAQIAQALRNCRLFHASG